MYKAYKDKVQFFLIYTREIHPVGEKGRDGKPRKPREGPKIDQHTSMEERVIAADQCIKGLKLTIPTLLDTMDNAYLKKYGGIPAGTAVIDIHGKIAYWTPGAAKGCKPDKAREAIKKLLAAGGGGVPGKWAKVKMPKAKPEPGTTTQAKSEAKPETEPASKLKAKKDSKS